MKKITILLVVTLATLSSFSQVKFPEEIENVDSTKHLMKVDQLEGGYWQLADETARDAISADKRAINMMVSYNDSTFRYDGPDVTTPEWENGANWALLSIPGGLAGVMVKGDSTYLFYTQDSINQVFLKKANDTAVNLVVTTDFYWADGLGKIDADSFWLRFPYSSGTPGLYSFNWGGSAGLPNQTTGNRGVSFGAGDTSSGAYSFTHGIRTAATGDYSFAYGDQSTASGNFSLAYGEDDTASGDRSAAFGYRNGSSGTNSFAAGTYNRATGASSFALGGYNLSSGQYGFAANWTNEATGKASTAFGTTTYAYDFVEAVFGRFNVKGTGNQTAWSASDRLFSVGNGASDGSRNDAFLIYKNGNIDFGSEFGTDVTNSIFTFGNNLQGNAGYIEPGKNYCFSLGSLSSSEEDYSFSFGDEDTASGSHSFAVGSGVISSGSKSTAFGANIEAYDFHEIVFGRFNVVGTGNQSSWVTTDRLFTIGNGTSLGARNDAFLILKNGNTTIDANLTVGDTSDLNVVGFDSQYFSEVESDISSDNVTNESGLPGTYSTEALDSVYNWTDPMLSDYAFGDSSATIDLTDDVWSRYTNADSTLFISVTAEGFTNAGDSIVATAYCRYATIYFSASVTLSLNDNYKFRILKNGTTTVRCISATGKNSTSTYPIKASVADINIGDYFEFQIMNTSDSDDATAICGTMMIIKEF